MDSILCLFSDETIQLTEYVKVVNESTLVIGLLGNITACIVLMFSRSFHTLTGFYLLSLSAADILILTTSITYDVCMDKYIIFVHTESMYVTHATIYVGEFLFQTSVVASTLTVTAFTLERYLAICRPFFVQSLPNKSRVKKIIIGIWLISGLLALLPLADLFIKLEIENETLKATMENVMQYVIGAWAVLYFFMPMTMITVMYLLIWLQLTRRSNGIDCKVDRADTRTLTMFVIIVVAFFISWAPHYTCRVLLGHKALETRRHFTSFKDVKTYMNEMYLLELGKQATYSLSAALNPLIYTILSKKFREALKDLVFNHSRNVFDWSSRLFGSRNSSKTVETAS